MRAFSLFIWGQTLLALANSSWSPLVVPSRHPRAFNCAHHCPEELLSSEAALQIFSILPAFFTAHKTMLTALLKYCLFTGEIFPAVIHYWVPEDA